MGDVEIARRLQHVERAGDVGFDIGVRRVVGIRNRDQRSQMQHRVAPLHRGAHAVGVADVARDPHGVRAAMKGCDVVLHLAALIAIPYSYHSPDTYVDTNVKGTLTLGAITANGRPVTTDWSTFTSARGRTTATAAVLQLALSRGFAASRIVGYVVAAPACVSVVGGGGVRSCVLRIVGPGSGMTSVSSPPVCVLGGAFAARCRLKAH